MVSLNGRILLPLRQCALLVSLVAVAAAAVAADLAQVRQLAAAGRADEALRRLDAIVAAAPDDASAELLRGVLLMETGRSAEAERVFEAMTRRWPELPEPHNNLAVIQAAAGRYEQAVKTLLASLGTHSSYETAYDNLTRVYSRLAGEAYSQALSDGRGELPPVELLLLADLAAAPSPPTEPSGPAPQPVATVAVTEAAERPASEAVPGADPGFLAAVNGWAAAWSEQRADDYLAAYSRRFVPPDGVSRAAWRRQRTERLRTPRFIRVALTILGARSLGPDRAEVEFIQSYESDRYVDTVTKSLELVREEGSWKILAERVKP